MSGRWTRWNRQGARASCWRISDSQGRLRITTTGTFINTDTYILSHSHQLLLNGVGSLACSLRSGSSLYFSSFFPFLLSFFLPSLQVGSSYIIKMVWNLLHIYIAQDSLEFTVFLNLPFRIVSLHYALLCRQTSQVREFWAFWSTPLGTWGNMPIPSMMVVWLWTHAGMKTL